ncbi:MAG: DNA internalization-related competence protein ComEC/Rec2 [Rubrivivax sp.]|nr:DNA internalization-related competence protein ComEC/Rec2 [Rubrivivax sp.]
MTMFAWLAGAVVGALWRRGGRLMLWLPAPTAARWGGLLCACAYAVLAGWGVPAQRTVWMIGVVVLLRTLGLRWPARLVLLAAAVAVTAIDPWALLQPGFWLSFAAVGLLMASESPRAGLAIDATRWARLLATLRGGLRTQAVATVGLAPLTLIFFQQLSLVGFAANLVAIPLVTLLITPLALIGILVPACWPLAGALVQGLSALLALLAQWPLAQWTAAAAPLWAALAGLLGGTLLVLPLPWRWRALGLPLLLPLLAPPLLRPPHGGFETVVADVGQGTAVLLRTRRHLLVYDAGPRYSPAADAGQRVLLPLLRARGETRIDLLMLSHRDSDHVGGAAALLAHGGVAALSSSLADDHALLASGVAHSRCDAGQSWVWDGVHFEVLHPRAEDHASVSKANALSCVLRVQGERHSLLLSGDIEAAQEAALLARGAALRSSVLLVPHHGSRTSSTPAFIDAVAPHTAVVQAAYRSRYGHPAPDVQARYEARGISFVRSDRCGAWTLAADGASHCERERARRYWHHRSVPSGAASAAAGAAGANPPQTAAHR